MSVKTSRGVAGFLEKHDLSQLPVSDFIEMVNEHKQLGLSKAQLQSAASVLNEQWFCFAAELAHVDKQAFAFLDLPSKLSEEIFAVFSSRGRPVSAVVYSETVEMHLPASSLPKTSFTAPALSLSSSFFPSALPPLSTSSSSLASPIPCFSPPPLSSFSPCSSPSFTPLASSSACPSSLTSSFSRVSLASTASPLPSSLPSSSVRRSSSSSFSEGEETQNSLPPLNSPAHSDESDEEDFKVVVSERKRESVDSLQQLQQVVDFVCTQEQPDPAEVKRMKALIIHAMKSRTDKLAHSLLRDYLKKLDRLSHPGVLTRGRSDEEHLSSSSSSSLVLNETCLLCKTTLLPSSHHLACKHIVCTLCLQTHILDRAGQKQTIGMCCPVLGCAYELTTADVQAILSSSDFASYLEATFMAFIEQDSMSFVCPNLKCNVIISLQARSAAREPPFPMTEKDPDGKLLSVEAWRHFHDFRVRCRECQTVFCAQCKGVPYHIGFTCVGFKEYRDSCHCRFCGAQLDESNKVIDVASLALRDVCTEAECVANMQLCCDKFLPCGCPCNGVRDEPTCLPCLKHELSVAEDFCPICYVATLAEAPCVQVACGHVIHYKCVTEKIASRWPNARITFAFLGCPQCSKPIRHWSLENLLAPCFALQEIVSKKALQRLEYEGRMKDPAIMNASGSFLNDALGFAMQQYLFYQCFLCKKPYFAGGYQCQEAVAAFDPEELVCPGCQPGSVEDCKLHGKDWLTFKCRYCCSVAAFHCWAKTHFCDKCHKSGTWQELVTFRTGKNKKRIWQHTQCEGLAEKVKAIGNDIKMTEDQKEEACAQLLSIKSLCPLKVAHPPNGLEFGLGCSMCDNKAQNTPSSSSSTDLSNNSNSVNADFLRIELGRHHAGKVFAYTSDFDTNGVMYYLGSRGKTQAFSNPCLAGLVAVTCSGLANDSEPVSAAVGREAVRCVSKPVKNSWFCFELKNVMLHPTMYSLRHYTSWDTECLRDWVLEGSKDGVSWDALVVHKNDEKLNGKGSTSSWPVLTEGKYRFFRVVQTGRNSNNNHYLPLSGFEIYGVLFGDSAVVRNGESMNGWRTFTHQHDFDQNGIVYHLGTLEGGSWRNPAEQGIMTVTASSLAVNPPSLEPFAAVGRECIRCCTLNKPNMWFVFDFKERRIIPESYTLRHYSSWDLEALRNWRFEGWNGHDWSVISEHINDQGLNGKGSTFTWEVQCKTAHSSFRIFQTGKNSNAHHYLCISGFEIYGKLFTPPVAVAKKGPVQLRYAYDFDANGLFYWLGSQTGSWVNPAETGLVNVTHSALAADSVAASAICGREVVRCVSMPKPNMWFCIDLKDLRLCPTHYSLRHYSSWDTEALRSWRFEGAMDAQKWTVLSAHSNDKSLNRKGATQTWPINAGDSYFRYFRLWQTGANSNNNHYLALSGMELYGTLKDSSHRPSPTLIDVADRSGSSRHVIVEEVKSPMLKFEEGLEFVYSEDLDTNGILYYLGSGGKTQPWINPEYKGVVCTTSSALAKDSESSSAIVGREVVRCVTQPAKDNFFMIDLRNYWVCVSAYTLRHYSSWDSEAIREWKFQGSNDGERWHKLMSHKHDESLNGKGATHTWILPKVKKRYRMFRILQTGQNSNGHWYLAISGLEIYGKLYTTAK